MSPVSPVFQTVVTAAIGLKTQLEWEHPLHRIRCVKGQTNKQDRTAQEKHTTKLLYLQI